MFIYTKVITLYSRSAIINNKYIAFAGINEHTEHNLKMHFFVANNCNIFNAFSIHILYVTIDKWNNLIIITTELLTAEISDRL